MNDFNIICSMLEKIKTDYQIKTDEKTINHYKKLHHPDVNKIITIQNSPQIIQKNGYTGFCSVWLFNINGDLLQVSHWES